MKKTLIIIGASGALGKGISKVLVGKDYDACYLVDSHIAPELKDISGYKFIESGDLSIEDNVQKVFNRFPPDREGLFFCYSTVGGYAAGKPVRETDYSEWNKMFKLNADISFLIGKYFSKLTASSGGGSIIFTASGAGLEPQENKAAYGASKAALIHFVKTLAAEGRKHNMSANAVAPYILDTPENRSWVSDEKQLTKIEHIAETARFIFSNYKSFTGNIISMKGDI
ncbi:MAG TPA: SDR family NAD(P)-dependent oxidoreductase [Ignavibacteriales bacterium]|nr:SDR family NAD(P)-dependent oxidoreductase [Ignavibacteriales bacterium]